MICQSGSLSLSLSRPLSSPRSPSSRSPSPTSLTETLSAQDGVLQPSVELYSTVTSTILWFGGQSTGLSTETPVIDGGVLSTTVTAWMAVDELPKASVAV